MDGAVDGAFDLPDTNAGWNLARTFEKREQRCVRDAHEGQRAVVIGGGTGAPVSIKVLLALGFTTSAVVAMADDGGSSGLLRKEAGSIPPGDIRKCLVAMAADSDDPLVRAFKVRFEYARNHTLGNLVLTALAETTHSFPEAISICEQLLGARGHVYPSTLDPVTLSGRTRDGCMREGQAALSGSDTALERVWLRPEGACAYEPALEAIEGADLIVLGPGSVFTSIIPNLLVSGVIGAIRDSHACTVLLCPVADMQGETWGLSAKEIVDAVCGHGMQGLLDVVCVQADDAAPGFRRFSLSPQDESALAREIPVVLTRQMVDAVYPTWHSPRALGQAFEEALEACRSRQR